MCGRPRVFVYVCVCIWLRVRVCLSVYEWMGWWVRVRVRLRPPFRQTFERSCRVTLGYQSSATSWISLTFIFNVKILSNCCQTAQYTNVISDSSRYVMTNVLSDSSRYVMTNVISDSSRYVKTYNFNQMADVIYLNFQILKVERLQFCCFL